MKTLEGIEKSRILEVGMGDYRVTRQRDKILVTYALGSCLGMTAFDAEAGVGGLLHFQLPSSDLDQPLAAAKPAVFGDTGIAFFLRELFGLGASPSRLDIKLMGGAQPPDPDYFNIGYKNLLSARRCLAVKGLAISREDTGGMDYRTVSLEMTTGRVTVKDSGGLYEI